MTRKASALDVARRLGHELPTEAEQRERIDREFPTPTPENVECPDCERLREEALRWRDWQSLDQGVFCPEHEE